MAQLRKISAHCQCQNTSHSAGMNGVYEAECTVLTAVLPPFEVDTQLGNTLRHVTLGSGC